MRLALLIIIFLCLSVELYAQKKLTVNDEFWATGRAEYILKDSSTFFYELNFRHSTNDNAAELDGLPFYWRHHAFGYEHRFGKLGLGGSIRFQKDVFLSANYFRIFLSHHTYWKRIEIRSVLLAERIDRRQDGVDDLNRVGVNIGVSRNFKTWDRWFRCGFALEGYQVNSPIDGKTKLIDLYSRSEDNRRWADKTRIRLSLGHWVSPRVLLSAFAMRETDYFFSLAKFNAMQVEIEPRKRLNRITPTFGITLRYLINGRSFEYNRSLGIF